MDDTGIAPARHKLDVDDFYRMAEAGILKRHDRVELIDGDLIDMAPIGQGHEATVGGLNEALVLACAGRAIVWPHVASDRIALALAPEIVVSLDLMFPG